MAIGQRAFSVAPDVAALDALEVRLAVLEAGRGAQHVATLRTVLELHALSSRSGMTVSTVPHAALALSCSEHRVSALLAQALGLAELPGALEAVECGLLTVEQSAVLVGQLAPLPFEVRLQVWRRLQARLADQGVLPPARLAELLNRWVIAADSEAAEKRRRQAEDGRRVDYRHRHDGLHDLFALGFRGPDMQAILSRIATRSEPVGVWDDRTADQRRFDALKDLLLGRERLPTSEGACPSGGGSGVAGCGCGPGSSAPCGAEVLVHMRYQAGLGVSDEPAELVGHGPIEPDVLQDLLLAGPRLRVVWADEHGVPLAVDERVVTVPRGDPAALHQALLELARRPPPERQPRSPGDHVPPQAGASRSHPGDSQGAYRPPRRVRRLVKARAPRCEWPGCGARAQRCDDEHDLAWPDGPTCACNLGPCCRHHHRVEQCGWVKTRSGDGSVTWTGRTGRSWLSPAQHPVPEPPVRPQPPLLTDDPLGELGPTSARKSCGRSGCSPNTTSGGRPTRPTKSPPTVTGSATASPTATPGGRSTSTTPTDGSRTARRKGPAPPTASDATFCWSPHAPTARTSPEPAPATSPTRSASSDRRSQNRRW